MPDTVASFVVKWAGAIAVGGLLGALAFVPFLASDEPTPKVITGVAIGVGFGIGQWLVVRHRLDRAVWWIVATVTGFAAAGALVGTGRPNSWRREV